MKPTRVETECKLLVTKPGQLAGLEETLRRLANRVRRRAVVDIHDEYFDTPDWAFYRAGFACRIRREDHTTWLALKELVKPSDDGVSRRMELEEKLVRPPAGHPRRLPGRSLGGQLRTLLGNPPLRLLFAIDNQRQPWDIQVGRLRVLVTADHVAFQAGVRRRQADEIELEVIRGPARLLRRLAARVRSALGLAEAQRSKFQVGLKLAGLAPPKPLPGQDLRMKPASRTVDVAYRILGVQANRIFWNEPGTRLGLDAEFLHQMRVATRRLRAALRIFADAIGPRIATPPHEQLKWLATALGDVRDLDVYLAQLPAYAAHLAEHDGQPEAPRLIERYQQHLAGKRQAARARLLTALNSPRYRALRQRIDALLVKGPPRSCRRADARRSIGQFARRAIGKRFKALLRLARPLTEQSDDGQLHQLRIAAKRLRYACEFVEPVCGGCMGKFIRRLVGLQDVLGAAQDAVVAIRLLDEFAGTIFRDDRQSAAALLALGQLIGWQKGLHAAHRAEFFRRWRKFDRARTRRDLRACIGLAAFGS